MSLDNKTVPFDAAFDPGAHSAIHICLRVQPGERVTLITDRASLEICSALAAQVQKLGSSCGFFILEDYTPRPMTHMPLPILESLAGSQVSVFCAQALRGELKARMEMTAIINANRLRHAHMVNISREIMLQGMKADFLEIDQLSSHLIAKARRARRIRATSPGGTALQAEFSADLKWIKTSGIIGPDKWGNLPGGEIFTSPARVDGVFVVDGVVGDYLCSKYGDLRETPLFIEIEDSRIVGLSCENSELLEDFSSYTSADENSNRVGEFAIGTNLAIKDIIGNILQDEKMPGLHIAFGHPYSEHTGQNWSSSTHIDCVGRSFDIWIEDEQVMKQGRFQLNGWRKQTAGSGHGAANSGRPATNR